MSIRKVLMIGLGLELAVLGISLELESELFSVSGCVGVCEVLFGKCCYRERIDVAF